ncbi:MAG: trypsin-like peptidase domain-containing protein [Proteobacteria bacterium]|nr:trypsin-like peptidase domain-containing protein [Luminiphilus sp.]MDA0649432.1 trypsin-like peptidase domain-containing protein [Pseudomonadota bacterium]
MIFRVLFLVTVILSPKSYAELPDFTEIVEEASPAVVKVLVEYESENPRYQEQLEELPEYLRRFFDFRGGPPVPRERAGMGSGFIISGDGYVVTNNHVVENARRVVVRLPDRQEFDAEVVGLDRRSDLAVLKIEGEGLPTLNLAGDRDVKVGQWVLAIGSPFSLDFSVTAGIVSALGRSLPTETGDNYVPFIQTDVAINPGNSGGPLFNLEGEVIGVNSQIFTRSGGSIGLSFAIPASVVRNVVQQIQETGLVERGWLGVSIQDVDRNLADSFGLDRPRGALIAQVGKDSPAEQAGLEPGDVILSFAGEAIETSADLPHVVGLIAPGTKVVAVIFREGDEQDLTVEVGGLGADEVARVNTGVAADGSVSILGMRLVEADPAELSSIGLSGGVAVSQVDRGSPADEAGVMTGDVLTRLGNQPVGRIEDLDGLAEQLLPGSSVPARLIRGRSPLFIGIRIPESD